MATLTNRITVRDVMKTRFGTINGMATIHEAIMMIKEYKTSMLVVDKRHADDEFGILLVSNIARKVLAKNRSSKRVNVYEVMTKPVVCVDSDMDIRYCSRLFARFNLVRALVVEDNKVLGTISPNRLVMEGLFTLEQQEHAEDEQPGE